MLATDVGLYFVRLAKDTVPEQRVVDPKELNLGFYNVAVSSDAKGEASVAVAARERKGVFLSDQHGLSKTFTNIGLKDEEVRVLEVQHVGLRHYLWAGLASIGEDPGKGCFHWLLTGAEANPEGWVARNKGWSASGCRDLTFVGNRVYAATLRGGVLSLDLDARDSAWPTPDANAGLPIRELRKLESVDSIAAGSDGKCLMAGGVKGIFRSTDGGKSFAYCSGKAFRDRVTLPPTWLFCSGEHEITVVGEE